MTEQKVEIQQIEAEERRRTVVLILLGVAALAALWFGGAPLPQLVASLQVGGGSKASALGNVVFVGVNGSQSFWLWAPPGAVAYWDVAFCNAAEGNATATIRFVEVPSALRRLLFYVGGGRFGWDGANLTQWTAAFPPKACIPARLEILVDGQTPRNAIHLVKIEVISQVTQ